MKKRSLFAAVAMLIVSAIVLTSATYAWFAVSEEASVDIISARVSNNKGAILLLPTTNAKSGAVPLNELDADNYKAFNTVYDPVSLYLPASGESRAVSFYKADFDGRLFTPGTVVDCSGAETVTSKADYINFGFQVQYKNVSASTSAVTLKPTLAPAPDGGQTCDFGYALVRVKIDSAEDYTDYYYRYDGADTFAPVTDLPTAGVTDTTEDSIVNTGDSSGYTLGAEVTTFATSGNTIQLWAANTAAGTHTADVEVYLWAEGNDVDCHGAVSASTIGISFEVK
jgi:hypothetical protein